MGKGPKEAEEAGWAGKHPAHAAMTIFQGFGQWDKSLLESYFNFDAYAISEVHKRLFVNLHNTIVRKIYREFKQDLIESLIPL